MASDAALLYLVIGIENLHKRPGFDEPIEFSPREHSKILGELLEVFQLTLIDVFHVRLGEQEDEHPELADLVDDNRAVCVLAQSLFPDVAAQIVGLTCKKLLGRSAQLLVRDSGVSRCLGEPSRLEDAIFEFCHGIAKLRS